MRRLFSAFCRALPTAPAVLRSSLYRWLPLGAPASFLPTSACLTAVLVAQVGPPPFPCVLSASPAPAGLQMIAGFCTLCRGSHIVVVTALYMAVWGALRLPEPLGLCLLFCHLLLRFSASVSASGWVCFWSAVSGSHGSCEVCAVSAALRGWPSFCCVGLSFSCSCGTSCLVAVFWPLLLLLWVELPWGVCSGVLSPWPLVTPSPSVVSRLGFLPLAFVQAWVGRLRFCLGSSLLLGGALLPLSLLFSLGCSNFLLSRLLEFLELFAGVSFLSLPVFAACSGWLTDSPWLSALRCLATGGVTLFFCQRPVGLPWWGRGASGFLGPAGFCVFAMGTPVSGWDCVLPQS